MGKNAFFSALNLKTKVIGLMLLLLAGGFWLLAYVNAKLIERDMVELLSAQQYSTASYIAKSVDEAIKFRIEALKANAAIITAEHLAHPEKLGIHLSTRQTLGALFKGGVTLVSRDGIGIADYPPVSGRQGGNFVQTSFFKDVLESGNVVIGKPVISDFSGLPGVSFAAPVKDKTGAVIAVLVGFATFSDPSLFGHVESARFGKSGYVVIDDPKHGLIVTASDPSRILTPMAAPGVNRMLDRFVGGYEGAGVAVNSRGVEVLTSAKRIPSTGWIVQLILPVQEAFAPIRELQRRSYQIAGALSLLAVFLAWWLLRNALRPLKKATVAIQDMVTGKAALHDLPVRRDDEIGSLLASFNRLVSERKRIEDDLRQSKEIFQAIGLSITESIFLLDINGMVMAANPTAAQRLGKSPSDLIGRNFFSLFPLEVGQVRRAAVTEVYATMAAKTVEDVRGGRNYSTTYYPVVDEDGECSAVVVVATDITERKKIEKELERLARTDSLTGLANRRHFLELAELELSRMARYGGCLSVLMMDIDHFKHINDNHGHKAGDMVLQKMGQSCREALRDIDLVGRMGGEEFAILLPQTDGAQAQEVAERLRRTISAARIALNSGEVLCVTVSLGVATLTAGAVSMDTLLNQADKALYQAKHEGRNRVCVFHPEVPGDASLGA
ncbi:sensor domain-containing diguanylate cyclase [Formivibrio citricus]|uniref:sensor domain-containing diguanylate cyclase n=1 Tax=Formivibrio citricus TaxID=83765 RepID=UPI0011609B49|nr:diguanylate cyclase [Formivibrio citricus]